MPAGFLLVLSGPSGAGKGTVCEALMRKSDDVVFSTSVTTRSKRPTEVDGVNYFFVDENRFNEMTENGELLEYAKVHENYYGTPKKFVDEQIKNGEIVILEIDVQGAMQVKKKYDNAIYIFLLPPNMDELKRRIIGRATEDSDVVELRFKNAFKELDYIESYDYVVINETVEQAVEDIKTIISAERLRVKRHKHIKESVTKGC